MNWFTWNIGNIKVKYDPAALRHIVNWFNDLPGILGNIKVNDNPAGRVKIGVVMVYTHKELQFYSSIKSKVYKRCFTRKCESKTEMC